jgi:hypothetical protein
VEGLVIEFLLQRVTVRDVTDVQHNRADVWFIEQVGDDDV